MKRRTALKQASAVAGTFAAAGCLSGGSGSGDGTESTTSDDGGDDSEETTVTEPATTESTTAAPMSMASKSLETTGTSCGSENTASVSFTDSGVSVEGQLPVSNPCHEAAFVSTTLDGESMTIVVEAVETDVDACQQCLAKVSYSAGVETNNGVPKSVTVKHRANGETTTVAEASN